MSNFISGEDSRFLFASASKISVATSKALILDLFDFSFHFFLLNESKEISLIPTYGVI